ncbi:MAG: acyltransferase [Bacteroidales bacterium]|nr:acyltransferase [Bacteroidales bacterium]
MLAQQNSWDALRLMAALMVLVSHQHALLGGVQPTVLGWNTLGGLGVSVFFFLSGALIWQSWQRDPAPTRFLRRRALRIFPGLWVVLLSSTFLLGAWVTEQRLSVYLSDAETWRYLSGAFLVIRHHLPGVFETNPYPSAVNGSLWTLPVEFGCYLMAMGVGLGVRRWGSQLVWGAWLVAVILAAWGPALAGTRFTSHFEMIAVFWWGVVSAETLFGAAKLSSRCLLLIAAVLVCNAVFGGDRGMARSGIVGLAAGLVVVFYLWRSGADLTRKMGDWSYGVYVYAFPVQQLWVHLGQGRGWGFGQYLLLSVLTTLALAGLSWHWVEKPALRFKPVVT